MFHSRFYEWADLGVRSRPSSADVGESVVERAQVLQALSRNQKPGFVLFYQVSRSSGWTDNRPTPPRKLPY